MWQIRADPAYHAVEQGRGEFLRRPDSRQQETLLTEVRHIEHVS